MEIRETRPWFWILVAALAVVAIGGLVVAISASNESIDQKALVGEATEQIEGELSGLDAAVEAANEIQAESEESAAKDRKQIDRDVEEAANQGQAELGKLKRRLRKVEGETESLSATDEKLERSQSGLTKTNEDLQAEVEELGGQVAKLEKKSEQSQKAAP